MIYNFTPDALGLLRYDSEFLIELENHCREILASEAFLATQEDIFAQTRLRDLQILTAVLAAVNRQQTRRGFPVPYSVLAAAQNEVTLIYEDIVGDREEQIAALVARLADDLHKHAVDSGAKIEELRSRPYKALAS